MAMEADDNGILPLGPPRGGRLAGFKGLLACILCWGCLPRKSRLRATMERYIEQVRGMIVEGEVVDAAGIFDLIPLREQVRSELEKPPISILDCAFRVVKCRGSRRL